MKKRLFALLIAAVTAFSVTACGESASTVSDQPTPTSGAESTGATLKVIATPAPASCSQVAVAEKLGYFEEEGVDVEIEYVTNLSDMASIIAGGGCDAAFNSFYTVMTWLDAGLDVKIIAANNDMGGTQAAAIRSELPISSPADLQDVTWGIVPGAEVNVAIMRMCQENGLDYESLKTVEVQPADQLSAFESGDIDVIACWEPWLAKAENMGGRFLLSGAKADLTGGAMTDVEWLKLFETTVVPTSAISTKKDELGKLLKAVARAEEYINSNRDEAVKIVAEVCDSDVDEIAGIMEKNDYRWGVDSIYVDTQSSLEKFMFENKIIEHDINFDEVHDFSILKEACPDYYTAD